MYLSEWMTFPKPLVGMDGATYLFRVVAVEKGREPHDLDEVADRVADDLRLLRGMERAKAAAEDFVENIGTNGLKDAWEANVELSAKVTPDRGGYLAPSSFPRDSTFMIGVKNVVLSLGRVTDEFIDVAFALAAEGEDSRPAIAELPDEAEVVIIKGKRLSPLYEEMYQQQRSALQKEFSQRKAAEILLNWLNAKHVRERNQWKPV
jgi:hypothetical protein